MTRTLSLVAALALAVAATIPAGAAHAQDSPAPASSAPAQAPADSAADLLKAANQTYNAGDYAQAALQFRQVIQRDPQRPIAYRNLARSYFWQAEYPEAVAYYDFYLRVAPEAQDRQQVESERRLAASRAAERVWRTPPAQAQAFDALEAALETGHAYSAGAGGAWGIYRSLLRTGFAQPELAGVKRRLVRKLLDEYVGLLVPAAGQPVPRMELDDWRVQLERLDAVKDLSDDPAILQVVSPRALLARAAVALLSDRADRAKTLSAQAAEENPDMPFIGWFQVRALLDLGEHQAALDALDALSAQLSPMHPDFAAYADILRAAALERLGQSDEAAQIYLRLLPQPTPTAPPSSAGAQGTPGEPSARAATP